MKFDYKILKNFDFTLFCIVLILTSIGILTIFSTTSTISFFKDYYQRQLIWFVISLIIFIIILFIDYNKIVRYTYILYVGAIGLLVITLFLGTEIRGAKSWLIFGIIRIQPSELAKIFTILALAKYLANRESPPQKLYEMIIPLIIFGLPMALILKQPDLGTVAIFIPIFFMIIYMANVSKKIIIFLIFIFILSSASFYPFLSNYQKDRIKIFLNPSKDLLGKGYNLTQSKIAIGSGRIFGKGFRKGTQATGRFLPEHHTDFIFASWAEQFGLIGSSALLLLYAILIIRSFQSAILAKDNFSKLTIIGFSTMVLAHTITNISTVMGLLPISGLPLPFMSYGGSSLLAMYIAYGIIFNFVIRRYMF